MYHFCIGLWQSRSSSKMRTHFYVRLLDVRLGFFLPPMPRPGIELTSVQWHFSRGSLIQDSLPNELPWPRRIVWKLKPILKLGLIFQRQEEPKFRRPPTSLVLQQPRQEPGEAIGVKNWSPAAQVDPWFAAQVRPRSEQGQKVHRRHRPRGLGRDGGQRVEKRRRRRFLRKKFSAVTRLVNSDAALCYMSASIPLESNVASNDRLCILRYLG